MFGDLTCKKNALEVEYLEFTERLSKTQDGGHHDDSRPTIPKIFCSCASASRNECTVEAYKEYWKHRPTDFCKGKDPFYLQAKTDDQIRKAHSDTWCKQEPMGIHSIGKLLPKACELAQIPMRGNHRLRATTVQRLRQACVPDDKIIQIMGHKSARTLQVYDTNRL